MNNDYENINNNLTDTTKKILKYSKQSLQFFSIIIIIYLIASFISNNYISGLAMNFIPIFLPVGYSFCPKPMLGSLFHSQKLPENSSKFFKNIDFQSGNQSQNYKYYELLDIGASFSGLLKGISGLSELLLQSNFKEINLSQIFLIDYQNSYWYQKIILIIFASLQIIIGTATTIFSSLAYLFSSKHGLLLNLPEEKKRLNKAQKFLFKNKGLSMVETETDKAIFKSGWSKFGMFFNYIFFIFADKLTYGTRYFVEDKHSSFFDRFKYFFLILFLYIIYTQLKDVFITNSQNYIIITIIIIAIFIFFAKKILNPFQSSFFPSYEGLLEEIKYSAMQNESRNTDYTFDELANNILKLQKTINESMQEYTKKSENLAKKLNFQFVEPNSSPKPNLENAQKNAKRNLDPLSGGKLKVKPQFKKIISQLKKELRENKL